MRLAIVVLAVLLFVGCTTNESIKYVEYQQGSINLHPFPFPTQEVVNEAGEVSYEMILPDGTYLTIQGMPNMGNLTLVTNQNDGTDQATDVRSDAQLDADVSVVPGE